MCSIAESIEVPDEFNEIVSERNRMNLMQVFLEAFRAMGMAVDKGLSLWGTPIVSARK